MSDMQQCRTTLYWQMQTVCLCTSFNWVWPTWNQPHHWVGPQNELTWGNAGFPWVLTSSTEMTTTTMNSDISTDEWMQLTLCFPTPVEEGYDRRQGRDCSETRGDRPPPEADRLGTGVSWWSEEWRGGETAASRRVTSTSTVLNQSLCSLNTHRNITTALTPLHTNKSSCHWQPCTKLVEA